MVRGRLKWLLFTAGGPAILLITVESGLLVMALVDRHPRWAASPMNVAEAAAVRDSAEMVRLLEHGVDPDERHPVRPGLLNNEEERQATPLEAAVYERRAELVYLLFDHGAHPAPAEWLRLRCASEVLGFSEIVDALGRNTPAGVEVRCSGNESIW